MGVVLKEDDMLEITFLDKLNEELICTICFNDFIDAVTFRCSHTYCKLCIEEWRQQKNTCPICAELILGSPVKNRLANNLVSLKQKYELEMRKLVLPGVKPKIQENRDLECDVKLFAELSPLTEHEFNELPRYLVGSIKFNEIQSFINVLNGALKKKYGKRKKPIIPLHFKNTCSGLFFEKYGFLSEGELLKELKSNQLNKRDMKILVILKKNRIFYFKQNNCLYIVPARIGVSEC